MVCVHLPLVKCEKDPLTCRKEKNVCQWGKHVCQPVYKQSRSCLSSYQASELQSWQHPWTATHSHHVNTLLRDVRVGSNEG